MIERAYVFGGCGRQEWVYHPTTKQLLAMEVQATHGNYGKTPGFVEKIFIEQCLESELPTKPNYVNEIDVKDPLIPGTIGRPINNALHIFPAIDGQIYYGRIIYRDIFSTTLHHSSFIYRFFADGHHEPMGNVDAEYWHWD